MKIDRLKLVYFCDSVVLFSVYSIAFFLPISKALIESFICLAFVFYLLKKIINREGLPVTWLNFAMFVYVIVCFFTIFISTSFKISIHAFLFKLLKDIIFVFVVVDTLNSKIRIKNMLYVLLISSALLGVDGIFQFFTHHDFLRHRPEVFDKRLTASFKTANAFGCFLVAIIPYSLVQFFIKTNNLKLKLTSAALFFVLLVCLILTVSRGAWFAFIGSILFMSIWLPYLGIAIGILSLLVAFTLQFSTTLLNVRLNNFFIFKDGSSIVRIGIWQAGWNMFKASPWLGLGLGTFMFNFKDFVEDKSLYIAYAHNCYLQISAETGIIGLISFLLILIFFFFRGIRLLVSTQKTFDWYLLLATLASLLGYCIHMAVETILYSVDLGLLFWLIMGFGVAIMNSIEVKEVSF
jgi:O-antigen ligase